MTADADWFRRVAGRPVDASLWEGGVRLAFVAAGVPVILDVHARRPGAAYATTPSFTLYLRAQGLTPAAEEEVRQVVAAIAAADPGGLALPKGEERPEDEVAPELRVEARPKSPPYVDAMSAWLEMAHALPGRLRQAACLAWEARRRGEPYPFPSLGAAGAHEDLRAWLLDRWPAPVTREELAAAGFAPEALMAVIDELRALGVAEVRDDGVRFHPGTGADVAIHAVWLWSPEVRAAAWAAWGASCDGRERERLDRAGRGFRGPVRPASGGAG